MEHDSMTLEHIQPQDDQRDADRPARPAIQLPTDTVSVTIDLGSGGRRTVELPADQVEGRSADQIFGLALEMLDNASDYDTRVFGDHARARYRRPDASVEIQMEGGPCAPTTRDSEVRLGERRTLRYRLGMDHVGGA